MPVNGKRFELPALAPLNFSLTDGTNIPPPPDSPIEEEAPPPAAPKAAPTAQSIPQATPSAAATTSPSNGHAIPANENAQQQQQQLPNRGRAYQDDIPPVSPASSKRPSSIRRFLSRKSLNANYTNGTNHNNSSFEDLAGGNRPDSPSSFLDGRPALKKVKSGSWFTRLGGGSSNNRSSVIWENRPVEQIQQSAAPIAKGPPPPKLPELNQLKAKVADDDEGSLGGEDMFKNIR